jgi:hypothetical protein
MGKGQNKSVETWWLGHEASTVLDINHGSVDIKSPPC